MFVVGIKRYFVQPRLIMGYSFSAVVCVDWSGFDGDPTHLAHDNIIVIGKKVETKCTVSGRSKQ